MDQESQVRGLSFRPEKVPNFEEWAADVKLEIRGDPTENAFEVDWIGQTRQVSSAKEFVENILKILAVTQSPSYRNRLCWGAKFSVDSDVLDEQLTPEKVDQAFTCYGEQLVIGVVKSKKTDPDWLVDGTISITSYMFRMTKNVDCFLDESGAKWGGDTVGISCTAIVDGSECIPNVLLSTPGATLLSKFIRAMVVTNLGVESSEVLWFKVLVQMSEQTEMLSKTLSAFAQVWDIDYEQLLGDADRVWEWVESSFTGEQLELSRNIANALFALPFHDRDGPKSLCAKQRPLPVTLDGFHHLSDTEGWKYVARHFWLSFRTISLDIEQSAKIYYYDILYRYLIEEEIALKGADEHDVAVLKEYLSDLDAEGHLDPCPKPFVEHLAGETLAQDALQKDCRVAQIRLEARASSTIELTTATTFPVRVNGRRARLVITEGSELLIRGKDVVRIAQNIGSALQGVSFMGFGANWVSRSNELKNLKGSMVANLVMQGEFGPEAGLWLLSHILYGDLKVSSESENGLIQSLATDSEGLKISVAIDAGIVASIHAATDGGTVFLCLSRTKVFTLKRAGGVLKASPCNVDVQDMKGCSLSPRRAVS